MKHADSRAERTKRCGYCGMTFTARLRRQQYCSITCGSRASTGKRKPVHERSTAGLSHRQRAKLLRKWKQQGRRCTYCPAIADTIDHVIPHARGGHHYIGNLTPACRSCNSAKADLLIVEWKHGYSPSWTAVPPTVRQHVPPKTKPVRLCPVCKVKPAKRITCSTECSNERHRQRMRDKYRKATALAA